MNCRPLFTVFTPTYNRAGTLPAVYAALAAQSWRDFEWLIVDDGSADGTADLVAEWQRRADFSIRYLWQENGGKHRAFNRGVREALGELFLTLDSDDTCLPRALERFAWHWQSIPAEQRLSYSAVTALCMDPAERTVGNGLPAAVVDSDPVSLRYRHHVVGEKWGFQRTDLLRQFPFPEFPGERFVPESLVWNRIGRKYRTRYVNEPLRVYRQGEGGLSQRSVQLRIASPCATLLYYRELLEEPVLSWRDRLGIAVNLWRFALHAGKPAEAAQLAVGRPWILLVFPAALAFCLADRRH